LSNQLAEPSLGPAEVGRSERFIPRRLVPTGDVALVHDYLLVMRGAERTFRDVAACWPGAPIHTLLYDAAAVGDHFAGHRVRASALQRLGLGQDRFRALLPLFPVAVERLRVGDARVVVSSSSAFAHGIHPPEGSVHVCYCHSPFRYVWHERERAVEEFPPAARRAGVRLLDRLRRWDLAASERVTQYIANSRLTARRIGEAYGREAAVVHPPVGVHRFAPSSEEPEPWFLLVGELVRHKRPEVALEAAARAGVPMKVVGGGPELAALSRRFASTAEFLGRVGDEELAALYPRASALVVPAVEEFGITAVEAQAAGRPVIAAAAGGALETVVDGETGVLVPPGDVDSLARGLRDTDWLAFDPSAIRAHALQFSTEAFRARLVQAVERAASGAWSGA
jgi:glycosyltransferase involved in cell wall biosynthesis